MLIPNERGMISDLLSADAAGKFLVVRAVLRCPHYRCLLNSGIAFNALSRTAQYPPSPTPVPVIQPHWPSWEQL